MTVFRANSVETASTFKRAAHYASNCHEEFMTVGNFMRHYRLFHRSISFLALAAAQLCSAPLQAQTPGQTDDTIVVTARKRAETLLDVPVSVAAFTGEKLAIAGVDNFADLANRVAGVSIQDGGPGYRTVYLRGVSTEVGGAATTGFYIDEVFVEPGGIIRTIVEPNYFDVARVEVLRGPQGTLFGGSSMGGTIRVVNNKPDLSRLGGAVGGELSATRHGGVNYQVDGIVNLPIVPDRVALRVAASHRRLDGVVDRLVGDFSGPGRTAVGPVRRYKNSDVQTSTNLRATLELKPTETLTITPSVYFVKARSADFSTIDIEGTNRKGPFEAKHFADLREPVQDRTIIGNLTATLDLGGAELLSSTSYIKRDSYFIEDLTNNMEETYQASVVVPFVQFLLNDPGFAFPAGRRFATPALGRNGERSWQQEIRLSSTSKSRFQYVLGAYYESHKTLGGFDMRSTGFEDFFAGIPGGDAVTAIAPDDKFFLFSGKSRRRQYAVFGELTYELLQDLKATAGLRYYSYRNWSETYGLEGFLFGGPLPPTVNQPDSDHGISPRFILSYQPNQNLNAYAQVAKGFRPGGTNAPVLPSCSTDAAAVGMQIGPNGELPGFKSDKLWNYELGVKAQFFDRRLSINQTVYRMDWTDMQNLATFPTCGFGYTANFGKARIYGSETEVVARPFDRLTLTGSLGFTHAELLQDIPSVAGATKGDQLPTVPRWTANASAEYRYPLAGAEGYFIVNYGYVGKSYRDFLNRPGRNNLVPGVDVGARRSHDAYSMVNLRAGLSGKNWNAAVFVNNLFDVQPRVFWFASSLSYSQSYDRLFVARPRTIGLNLRHDF
jgi:iron complex outermembrane receptor protein